jgi:hypothetical protein
VRVGIGQVHDQSQGHLIVLQVIQVGAGKQTAEMVAWPTHGVHDLARHVFFRVDVPQLLEPDTVVLGAGIPGQIELLDQLLAEMSSYPGA